MPKGRSCLPGRRNGLPRLELARRCAEIVRKPPTKPRQAAITNPLRDDLNGVVGVIQKRAGFFHSLRHQKLTRRFPGLVFKFDLEMAHTEVADGGQFFQ